jgi:hypothetical protein
MNQELYQLFTQTHQSYCQRMSGFDFGHSVVRRGVKQGMSGGNFAGSGGYSFFITTNTLVLVVTKKECHHKLDDTN